MSTPPFIVSESYINDLLSIIPVISFMHSYSYSIILYDWVVVENNFLCLSYLYSQLFVFLCLFLSRFNTNTPPFTICESCMLYDLFWYVIIFGSTTPPFTICESCIFTTSFICVYSHDSFIHDSSSFHSVFVIRVQSFYTTELLLKIIFVFSLFLYSRLLSHVQYVIRLIFYSCYLNPIPPLSRFVSLVLLLYHLFLFVIILVLVILNIINYYFQ